MPGLRLRPRWRGDAEVGHATRIAEGIKWTGTLRRTMPSGKQPRWRHRCANAWRLYVYVVHVYVTCTCMYVRTRTSSMMSRFGEGSNAI
eukprot:scaffold9150_cov120-Isochrysis_galbana.AAC.2